MARRRIVGPVFVIEGAVESDAILAPRHLGHSDLADMARNCFADLNTPISFEPGQYRLVIATCLFGVGLVRPPVPLALQAAGVEAIIAPSMSPLFFEHGLNAGAILPLEAKLPRLPQTGALVALTLDGEQAELAWPDGNLAFRGRLPGWALDGRSLIDTLRRRAKQAGGLPALQASLRARNTDA
jgi:3-isopropylmalate dehydratase small subunit